MEEFMAPDLPPGKDSLLPPALFKTVFSQAPRPAADEEPIA
jgi:hypothetical protein